MKDGIITKATFMKNMIVLNNNWIKYCMGLQGAERAVPQEIANLMFLSYRNYTGSCGIVKLYKNILSRFDPDTFFLANL